MNLTRREIWVTATHYNTLQQTATHYNTLQQTATPDMGVYQMRVTGCDFIHELDT